MVRTLKSPQGGKVNLDGAEVINMAAINYLGLANSAELITAAKQALDQYGVGPGAGRTIYSNELNNELEIKLAQFKGVEAAITFNSGLAANIGVIPAMVGKGDAIFSDELNHASIIDGARLAGAERKVYKHQDMSSLEELLKTSTAGKKLIATDAVFSMDGDLAPLPEIVTLAKRYGASILVDDAHGDGVMGSFGKGTVSYYGLEGDIGCEIIETGSLSKAFGVVGGFAAGRRSTIESIKQKARSFIFTSSPLPPSMAAALIKAVELLSADDSRVKKLWDNREYFASRLANLGFNIGNSKTPIIPLLVGDEELAKQFSQKAYVEGVFAHAILFPLVPKGKARLRVILSANHEMKDLDKTIDVFKKVGKELKVI